jgi:hypothetical protein
MRNHTAESVIAAGSTTLGMFQKRCTDKNGNSFIIVFGRF